MERLRSNAQFSEVYRTHRSFADDFLVMYIRKNGESFNRVGVSVSKKIGNSVVRHRVKRLVKEAFRNSEDMFNSGLDIVVVARACARDARYINIEESLLSLAGKARIKKNGGEK